MLKICHVTSVHKSTDIRIFEKECTSLAKIDNYKVYLVAKGDTFEKNNVSVVGVGNPPKGRINRMLFFSKRIIDKALELDADIYHLHDPELLQYVPLLKRKNKVVVFDSHENVADSILDKDYIPQFGRKFIALLYSFFSSKKMRKCDALISVTPHIVKKLRCFNNDVSMITNFPLMDSSEFKLIHQDKKNNNEKHIIFAGGISPQWSHHLIISALEHIEGVKYELYGPSSEEYLSSLKAMPGWSKTHYYGTVPFYEVQEALRKADITIALLQPSHNTAGMYGTIGNTKLFESMNAELPIICTNFTLWKDIVESNQCGICIPPDSEEELIRAISFLLDNKEKSEEMGRNGRMQILHNYNWNSQEIELYSLYKRLELKTKKKVKGEV